MTDVSGAAKNGTRRRAGEIAIVIHAFVQLLLFDLMNRLGGFPVIRGCVLHTKTHRRAVPADVRAICDAVEIAACFYHKRVLCLHRSFAAVRLLRKGGVEASLIIASRPAPFMSHAWVEVSGSIVNDLPGYKRKLTIMDTV